MKTIKVEWCENWIRKTFEKLLPYATGIEHNVFWEKAEKSRLYEKGTFNGPMTQALINLNVKSEYNGSYHFFKL